MTTTHVRRREPWARAAAVPAAAYIADVFVAMDWQQVTEPPDAIRNTVAMIGYLALGGIALVWRKKRPVASHAFVLVWATFCAVLLPAGPVAIVLVSLFALARYGTTRSAHVAAGLTVVPLAADVVGAVRDQNPDSSAMVGVIAIITFVYVIVFVLVWVLGRQLGHRDRRVERLELDRDALAREAVLQERQRLARDLHDIVSHAVSVIVLQAAGARRILGAEAPDEVAVALENIEHKGKEAMGELRRLLGVMRDSAQIPVAGNMNERLAELPALVTSFESAGVAIELSTEGEVGHLAPSVDLTAYRVLQEALTNTAKHAGPGSSAQVHMRWDDELVIDITDQAESASPLDLASSGLGLIGMRERVKALGGKLESGPTSDGHGFQLHVVLPRAEDP